MSEPDRPRRPFLSPTRLLPRLAVAAASFAISFALAELYLRADPSTDRLGWNRVPSVEERLAAVQPVPEGERRILGLGDSFADFRDTDGRNFLRVLESEARAAGHPAVLDNLGEAGAGVSRYRELLDAYLERATPEIAVIALYLGNDLLDYEVEARKEARGIEGERSGSGGNPRPAGWKDLLRKKSTFANALFRAAKEHVPALRSGTYRRNLERAAVLYDLDASELAAAEERIAPGMVARAEADAINAWDLAFGVVSPGMYDEMLALDGGYRAAFEALAVDLRGMAESCRAAGVKPLFVLIPPSVQVSGAYHDYFHRLGHTLEEGVVGDSELSRELRELAQGAGWPCIDLRESLTAAEGSLYIPDDIHWNVTGQRVAGETLFGFLEATGWLEDLPEGPGEDAVAQLR